MAGAGGYAARPPTATPNATRIRVRAALSRLRYRIDIVLGQFSERCAVRRVRGRGAWHLSNRLRRKALMHTLAVLLKLKLGRQLLRLAQLVAS